VNRRREHGRADPEPDQSSGSDEHEASDRRVAPGGEQRGAAAERMTDDDGTLDGECANELAKPDAVGVAIAGTFRRREARLSGEIDADRTVFAPDEGEQFERGAVEKFVPGSRTTSRPPPTIVTRVAPRELSRSRLVAPAPSSRSAHQVRIAWCPASDR
jgi:hypothetical protein